MLNSYIPQALKLEGLTLLIPKSTKKECIILVPHPPLISLEIHFYPPIYIPVLNVTVSKIMYVFLIPYPRNTSIPS
jgi:hypothetical protein